MRQRFAMAALAIGGLVLSTAWAGTNFADPAAAPTGAHYRQGFAQPSCSVTGLTVSCTGTVIGGVGNTDADLVLSVSYSATVQCQNHGGKIVDVKTQLTASSSFDDATEVKNGQLIVDAVTSSSPTEQSFKDAASCPNGNWDKLLLGSPVVTGYTYTLTFHGYTVPAITLP